MAATGTHASGAAPADTAAHATQPLDGLGVLADPHRIEILRRLADGGVCTCDLVDGLALRQPTVSHHLKQLREHGLVVGERRGRFTQYRLVPEALEELADELHALAAEARRTCC